MNDIQYHLQQTLLLLEAWERETGFRFSTKKSKAIQFCKLRTPHSNPTLEIHNQKIIFTDTIKFLGLT